MADNPFKKLDGGKPAAPTADPNAPLISDEASNLCPFVGTIPMMMAPAGKVINPNMMPQIEHVLMPCVGERCAIWHKGAKCCGAVAQTALLNSVAETLLEVRDKLAPLAKMFGR